MIKIILAILLLSATIFATEKFELKNASKIYDVKIEVAKCENGFCEGAATFTLLKKGEMKPFQIFKTADTSLWLDENDQAQANVTLRYDEQSAVNFGDFNFDGVEDLALCDGKNSGYGMPSYQIYLFSPRTKKFVHNPALSRLAREEYLGMFEVNEKNKTIRTASKSGCCWHQTQEFKVVKNRPQKVLEITEDRTVENGDKMKITTRRLIGRQWKTTVKYEKGQASN